MWHELCQDSTGASVAALDEMSCVSVNTGRSWTAAVMPTCIDENGVFVSHLDLPSEATRDAETELTNLETVFAVCQTFPPPSVVGGLPPSGLPASGLRLQSWWQRMQLLATALVRSFGSVFEGLPHHGIVGSAWLHI